MNLMMRVSDNLYIVADEIAAVEIQDDRTIRVSTKSGTYHTMQRGYGETVYDSVEKFNAAVSRARLILAGANHELKTT